ncbi:MAG: tetratricopeptide repeat protein [Rhodothermales bacterium]
MRTLASAFAVGLALVLSVAGVMAQPEPDCAVLLSRAQDHYTSQRFDDAEQAVRACLERPAVGDPDALGAYRLLALIHLRQDDLAEAKRAVIRLLGVSFDYRPDPVLDPPTYVALVETIRDQLRVADVPPPRDATEAPMAEAPALPTQRASAKEAYVGVSLGAGSYSGERGVDGGSLVEEFRLNGGFSFALDGSYAFHRSLAAVASYRAVRLPLLLTNDVRPEDVQVRPDGSSAWVHVLALMARARIGREMSVTPYVQAGASGFFSRLNSEMRVGVGPQVGVGLDVTLTPDLVGFAEVNLAASFPGDAVDRVSTSGSSDLLTFLGAGLRYRVPLP